MSHNTTPPRTFAERLKDTPEAVELVHATLALMLALALIARMLDR